MRTKYLALVGIFIILTFLEGALSFGEPGVLSGTPSLSVDKNQYQAEETVALNINIDEADYFHYYLSITVLGNNYTYKGDFNPIMFFYPTEEDIYTIALVEKSTGAIFYSISFNVSAKNDTKTRKTTDPGGAVIMQNESFQEPPPAIADLGNEEPVLETHSPSLSTDKSEYFLGEPVRAFVNFQDDENVNFYHYFNGSSKKYMGDLKYINFLPEGVGKHDLILKDNNDNILASYSFEVKLPPGKRIMRILNSKGLAEEVEINLRDEKDGIGSFDIPLNKKTLKEIKLNNLRFMQDNVSFNLSLGVDEVAVERVNVRQKTVVKAFAINSEELNFSNGTVIATALGNALWKCKDWDFGNQTCFGAWQKMMDLIPGQDYEFEISPGDPGYAETNITILNVQSYPTVGGNWTVAFNTTGTADLSIRAVDGTTWTNYSEDGYDLKFLEVRCGNELLAYEWINGSVFIANYSCNETGFESSKVLTPGVHNLEFAFGDDIKYAHNNATVAPMINFTSPTPASGNITKNTSVQINVSIIDTGDLSTVIWNWNGTNTTIFNNNLFMLYNLNNNSALGENATKAVDVSRLRVNATIFNATWLASGRYGFGMNFSRTNGYINTSNTNSVRGLRQVTIAMWIRPTLTGVATQDLYHECISTIAGTSRFTFRVTTAGNLLLAARGNDTGGLTTLVQAPANITANQWQHVVGIFNNVTSYHQLYINGRLVANTSTALAPLNNSNPFRFPVIGNHNSWAEPFNGTIDEVMMWNRTLTSQEVLQLYMTNLRKYNSTQWYLYVNQSRNATAGLEDGLYTYLTYAIDSSNNANQTDLRNITIDTAGPITTLDQPANFTNIATNTYTVNASVTDLSSVDTVTFMYRINATDTWKFACNDSRGPDYDCTWNLSSLADGKDYQIRAYANDTLGTLGNNDTHINITIDRTGPNTSIDYPRNDTVIDARIIDFTYTINASVSDAMSTIGTVTFMYRVNSTDTWKLACVDADHAAPYNCRWDLAGLNNSHDYEILAYANDSLGNIGPNDTHVNITIYAKFVNVSSILVDDSVSIPTEQVDLQAGTTKSISCNITAIDPEAYTNITGVNATLYSITTTYDAADNNRTHYTNSSCTFLSGGGQSADYQCGFNVWHFAINGTWNCTAFVQNSYSTDNDTDNTTVNPLFALNISTIVINYNALSPTQVSPNLTVDISNVGNMPMNISVYGFGGEDELIGDGLSMICQINNISVSFERFATNNATDYNTKNQLSSTPQDIGLTIPAKTAYDEVRTNSTYWQFMVPPESHTIGQCNGTVVFQAESP